MEKAPAHLELVLRFFTNLTPVQLQQLAVLEAVYRDWNDKINTISRKDIGSLYENHVLHSLAIAAAFGWQKGAEIIDIGTGGGFPGIPLAIFFPDVQFHLVDSIGKKLKVVEAVRDATGLRNISTQHGRAEEIRNRKFDSVVSRAVAPLKELWTWSRPLLRKDLRRALPHPAPPPRASTPPPTPAGNSPIIPQHSSVIPQHSSVILQHPAPPPHASTPPAHASAPPPSAPPIAHGLICLKGGNLAAEIADSGCRPRLIEIHELFPLDYFREKYLLYVPAT
jgi:16S rRNA (guanine527-N7)-methyltransferase